MIDLALLSKLVLSALIALCAWAVQARGTQPRLAHLLWLLALLELLVPPLVTLPLLPAPAGPAAPVELLPLPVDLLAGAPAAAEAPTVSTGALLLAVWLAGSLLLAGVTLRRVLRFERLLAASAAPAPEAVRALAAELAGRLGLTRVPAIVTVPAQVSPLVWWAGGQAQVVLPTSVVASLAPSELRLVLAHELGHLRRRDHLVRWVEWLAVVGFWWNPVAWWARANLRVNEELCCDALVLASLQPPPKSYAASLLSVAEVLSTPTLRVPALASGIDGGGALERRLRMIVSPAPASSRWLHTAVLLGAVGLLPLGVAAQDRKPQPKAPEKAKREAPGPSPEEVAKVQAKLDAAVKAGKLTEAQAAKKLAAWKAQRKKHAHLHARIKQALRDAGIAEAQLEPTLKGMKQVIHGVMKQGKTYALDPKTKAYFTDEVKLSAEQLKTVLALAHKVAAHLSQRAPTQHDIAVVKKKIAAAVKAGKMTEEEGKKHLQAYLKRAKHARQKQRWRKIMAVYEQLGVDAAGVGKLKQELANAKLDGEQVGIALTAIARVGQAWKQQGDKYVVPPKLSEHLRQLGFDEAQIKLVIDHARKLASPM